ncbi:TetR family transcriptional regulator [Methylobacterium sp. J-070]|uniref:TetR family transcriptional regulator n=1 Tax=Methylobacterium sp. J-070 TaxID=2836650 RepID=UPI001FBA52F1|nr:TetR family transcriptional regulator [Methylobacterium sp. J-070]MCJ2049201.1 TetR family transcriptional regulator [Methylobacterium sp. J-070]
MPRVSQEQAKLNRRRVVEVAASLFRERGLHGVGVADIMASAGLTHGGFYGQFANKEALAAEAFDTALAEDNRGDLDTLVANYLSLGHVRSPGRGCPLAALANDVAREPPGSPVRARFTRGVEGLAAILAGLTPRGAKERRRQRSLATLATLVGAIVLARAVDDEALAGDLIEAAQASVTA